MFKKYRPFFKAGAMDLMAFKFAIFSWMIVSIVQVACTIFLWLAVYKNASSTVVNGFTIEEMITFQVFINIFTFVSFDTTTGYTINDEIKAGTIALSFTKPISYRLRFVATNLGSMTMMMCLFGIPFLTIAYIVFSALGFITFTVNFFGFLLYLLLFFMAALLASLINDAISYIFGILCFYTMAGFGLNQIKNIIVSFLSGALIPLSFFPPVAKDIVNLLPFAGMAQNPILILLMKMDYLEALTKIGLGIIWLIIIESLGALFFAHASKKITVQGG